MAVGRPTATKGKKGTGRSDGESLNNRLSLPTDTICPTYSESFFSTTRFGRRSGKLSLAPDDRPTSLADHSTIRCLQQFTTRFLLA